MQSSIFAAPYQPKESNNRAIEKILSAYLQSLGVHESSLPSCEFLSGGFSGASICLFQLKGRSYVLRLFKENLGFYDAVHQIIVAKLAGDGGIAPKTQIATKTSARTARSVPDTAVGIEEQGSSLAEMHTAVSGTLLAVLAERAIP